jgi:hypothetical protein
MKISKYFMARPTDFVDPDYDRRLAEFKAERDKVRKEMAEQNKQQPKRK